jgi:hypothetical protein
MATPGSNVSGLSAISGLSTGTGTPSVQFPRSLDVPKDAEISAGPSFASQIIPSLSSKSKNSDEHDLDISVASSTALNQLLAASGTMNPDDDIDSHISVDDSSDGRVELGAPTVSSVNSSDVIIRRVEEEIANARKAAQDANRRMAKKNVTSGWDSRNAKSTESSTFHSRNLDNMPSVDDSFHTRHVDDTFHPGKIDNDPSMDENMHDDSLNNNDSDVLDHDELYGMLSISDGDGSLGDGTIGSQAGGSFHSAMDVIGEEFGASTDYQDVSQEPDQDKKTEDTEISRATPESSMQDEDVNQAMQDTTRGVDATPSDEQKSEAGEYTQDYQQSFAGNAVDKRADDHKPTPVAIDLTNVETTLSDEEPYGIEAAFSDCAIKGTKPFREGVSDAEEGSIAQGRQQDDGDNTTFLDDLDSNGEMNSPESSVDKTKSKSAASANEENKEEDDLELLTTSAKAKSWLPENKSLTDNSSGAEVIDVIGATYEEPVVLASDGSCAASYASTDIATNNSNLAQSNKADTHKTPDIIVVDNIEDTSTHSEIPVEIRDATREPESALRVNPIEAEHTTEKSEGGIEGAPGSLLRHFWWNKGEEKEAEKKENRTRESVKSQQENEATTVEDDSHTNQLRRNKTASPQTTRQSSSFKSMLRSPSPQRAPSPRMMRSSSPVPGSEEYAKTAAAVEQRRALRSRTDNARAAIRDELGAGEQKATGDKSKLSKVRFRQRYPVPPLISKPRLPSEIMEGNKVETPAIALHLAKPKRDLQQLLDAIVGPRLPRRSNACGALKVLSMQAKNRLTLVRTAGFLDALVFAADDKINLQDKETAIDARTRAISCILNVSEPKDNRVIVFSHPRLPECLVKCILEDSGEARAAACGALVMLAKNPACREPMSRIENLVNVLAMIVKGVKEEPENEPENEPEQKAVRSTSRSLDDDKQEYSDDDKDSQRENINRSFSSDSSSGSSSGDESSMSSGDEEDHAGIPRTNSIRQHKMQQNDETAKRARLNACAALAHLSKHCGVSVSNLKYMYPPFHIHSKTLTYYSLSQAVLSPNDALMDCLIAVSKEYDNPMHTKCLEILCNLSRFPSNNAVMAKHPGLVDTLVVTGRAKCDADRVWSLRTLQNLSSDVAGKTILANCVVLELLSVSVMRKQFDEQRAAVATLYNLSTEPGAVVSLTNTKNVVATLVHVAHSPDSPSAVRLMACDALATLGLWLQTLAGAGTVPEDVQQVPLPSYATSGWRRWD